MLSYLKRALPVLVLTGVTVFFAHAIYTLPIQQELSLYDKIQRNTLHVFMPSGGRGSAVYITGNKALTAGHVCEEQAPKKIMVKAHDGKRYLVDSYYMYEKINVDLCLLTLELAPKLPGTKISKDPTALTQFVFIGGYSGGTNYSIRGGSVYSEEVVQIMDDPFGFKFITMRVQFMTVFGEGGISGSGVINQAGELVGIANIVGPAGLGMMPLDQIRQFLKDAGEEQLLK